MNPSLLLTSIRASCSRGFIALLSAALLTVSVHATPPSGYSLVWSDEFSGTALDTDYWNPAPGAAASITPTCTTCRAAGARATIS